MNLIYALVLITGQQPWCATDGDIFECYYYTPGRCEAAVEMSEESRWCERNPGLYQTPRKRDELRWWDGFEEIEVKGWYGGI